MKKGIFEGAGCCPSYGSALLRWWLVQACMEGPPAHPCYTPGTDLWSVRSWINEV